MSKRDGGRFTRLAKYRLRFAMERKRQLILWRSLFDMLLISSRERKCCTMMFPEYLLEDRITWDEYVKRRGYTPTKAFKLYRVIKYMFECKNQELPDGVAYFREKGWEDTEKRAVAWWTEICKHTFEDWA